MNDKDIIIEKLSKSFKEKRVLTEFCAVFPAGKVSIIMGESGLGKTTLLNILLGVEKPDSGSVFGIPSRISTVFQEDRLCEDFSAATNIRITAAKGTTPEDIRTALTALGLSENIKTPVRELSGGMKRRVAIARALLAQSSLVIMDEPMKGLDDATRTATAAFILGYLKGRTLIVVTHTLQDAGLLGAVNMVMMG